MCAIVIKCKDDKDGCLQFCSNPQRKAAITWPAGDKYIFLATQAIQRTSSKSLPTQPAVHLHNWRPYAFQIKLHLPIQLISSATASSAKRWHCLYWNMSASILAPFFRYWVDKECSISRCRLLVQHLCWLLKQQLPWQIQISMIIHRFVCTLFDPLTAPLAVRWTSS